MTEPVSGAESEDNGEPLAVPKRSTWRVLADGLSPTSVWAMADGYPVVIKQFLQFCLILVYPAWVAGVLAAMAIYGLFSVTVYPVLWVLFWPVRAWMKKNRPEEYAESQRKK